MNAPTSIDKKAVKELAQRLWERRGRPSGGPEMYRLEAERQIAMKRRAENNTVEEAGKESFPASDSPGSGLPDKPPANADEKWEAARKARQRAKPKRRRRTTV